MAIQAIVKNISDNEACKPTLANCEKEILALITADLTKATLVKYGVCPLNY